MEKTPQPGEIYRHFKNNLYQVIAVADHTETGEKLVVYQALYGTFGIYARPLSMFTGKTDREKYPGAKQEYRFERVLPDSLEDKGNVQQPDREGTGKVSEERMQKAKEADSLGSEPEDAAEKPVLHPLILSFVETEDLDVKLEILSAAEESAGQKEVDALCEALDLPRRSEDVKEQIRFIRQYLETRKKFDSRRLR